MAPPLRTLRVGRYLLSLLLLFVVLYAVVGIGSRQVPKLGIDLAGGKRIIFNAITTNHTAPSSDSMSQARQIIEDRVDKQGVTGSTVQVQNGDQLVVTIPGGTNTDVQALGEPAVLNFRGIMAPGQYIACGTGAGTATPTPSTSPSTGASSSSSTSSAPTSSKTTPAQSGKSASGAAGNAASDRRLTAKASNAPTPPASATSSSSSGTTSSGTTSSGSTPTGSGAATGSASTSPSAAAPTKCLADPIATLFKTDPGLKKVMPNAEQCPSPSLTDGGTCRAFSTLSSTRQTELLSAVSQFKCTAAQTEPDKDTRYYLACDDSNTVAYLLGHVVVPGREVSSSDAIAPGSNGQSISSNWSIDVNLSSSGGDRWNAWTSKYHTDQATANGVQSVQTPGTTTAPCGPTASATVPCSDFVAFTLNGEVVSTAINVAVLDRQTQITGNFTQSSADKLAQQLNYGRLPLSFKLESNQSVSATLGSVQLKAAFLAGGIGLLLVVLYSLAYYRGLGLVTIASLLVSAGLTYALLVILGTQIGYTLDLAGIAGFIVALGITADSFVVFFERIKDEVHEGRSMRVAVPRAWIRARRTILSADTVSFLAAAILYYFASADVKGFAFTLGLSTILDLVVVFLFTHPIVSLLSRSRTFGSPRFTGLNSVRTGPAIADDEAGDAAPRRRPARTAAASARERAAGRRGMSAPSATIEADDDEIPDDETVDDEPLTDDTVVVEDAARYDDGTSPADEATDDPVDRDRSGGTAAERAAARRARRRSGGSGTGSDSEGES